jgi:hypothetical protein
MTTLGCSGFIGTLSKAYAALVVLVASSLGVANAQVDCGTIPAGPGRTDCYIGLSRINQQKSEIAASAARQQTDSARYHQLTGSRPKTKRHRAVSVR